MYKDDSSRSGAEESAAQSKEVADTRDPISTPTADKSVAEEEVIVIVDRTAEPASIVVAKKSDGERHSTSQPFVATLEKVSFEDLCLESMSHLGQQRHS